MPGVCEVCIGFDGDGVGTKRLHPHGGYVNNSNINTKKWPVPSYLMVHLVYALQQLKMTYNRFRKLEISVMQSQIAKYCGSPDQYSTNGLVSFVDYTINKPLDSIGFSTIAYIVEGRNSINNKQQYFTEKVTVKKGAGTPVEFKNNQGKSIIGEYFGGTNIYQKLVGSTAAWSKSRKSTARFTNAYLLVAWDETHKDWHKFNDERNISRRTLAAVQNGTFKLNNNTLSRTPLLAGSLPQA